jgi:Secretion system C-terminal sorting domain/HmuY protein
MLLFNMKQFSILTAFLAVTIQVNSQNIQEIATGAGYQKQSYVNLSAGTEKLVNNTAWDIAFAVSSPQEAGVFVNESAGTSMGSPLPQVELYDALSTSFDEQPDPTSLTSFRLYNKELTWAYGAFNEVRDPLNPFDFGWGVYNPQSNQVTGSAVYVVKLTNGQYRKIQIVSLVGTTYTFKYANLDGSGLQTKTINKADHAGKTLAYFSFATGNTVDVEPAAGGFDLLYCRYSTTLYDPGTMTDIVYNVTGILSGRGVKAVKADGVNPATVAFADYQSQLETKLDVLGHDWKNFSGTAWSVDEDRVYFVKTADSRAWKLHFIDFEGSSTGKAVFEKQDLGLISAVQDPAAVGLGASIYPNPVQDELTIALDIPANLAAEAQLEVVDVQGRLIANKSVSLVNGFQVYQMPAAHWASGMYLLRLKLPNQEIKLGKIVK